MAGSRTAWRLTCVLAAAALLTATANAARAATVRVGRAAAVPTGATFTGMVPAATRLHVTIALRPRDGSALAAYARAVSTPGSADYRRYLTPTQFARRFGASAAEIGTVRRSLRARGLEPGAGSRGSLSISVLADAAQLERAFSVSLTRMALRGGGTAIRASSAPAVAASRSGGVRVVSAARHVPPGPPPPAPPASAAAPSQQAFTADEIASAYGFSGLYGA